ncbi:hypothetical protein GCM10027413_00720 [Conyzicola nivalis]|uniref:Glycosyltransferase 2-like domain-containing protein n=1 Tax=Conyzicola nivalis TaxID=1477021 RepID=A0A916WKH5_9MICO|nr:glycosyltransferase [Conyzicola nivalis]GGB10136.1 hypothetical protein GCM10010979_25920 [Conyzicola nivalis]
MRVALPREAAPASVTVVVPCYRYGHFLRRIVASILDQTDVHARVIIVDDASPDDSADVARTIAGEDARVSVFVHEQNRGHIATYNDGFALVETEFVSLVSADDLVAPGALGRATRLMTTHPTVGMVYGPVIDFVGDDVPTGDYRWGRETWSVWGGHDWFRGVMRRGTNPILSPEVVMRTAALREVGQYNAELPHSGDLEYWLRTAARWDVGRVNGRAQAYYRVHGANMHLEHFDATAEDLRQRQRAFAAVVAGGLPAGLDGAREYTRATRALAREALGDARRRLDRGASADSVLPLVEFAEAQLPSFDGTRRGRGVAERMRRAEAGQTPSTGQRAAEFARGQGDRVRWKSRNLLGIGNIAKATADKTTTVAAYAARKD